MGVGVGIMSYESYAEEKLRKAKEALEEANLELEKAALAVRQAELDVRIEKRQNS